MKWYFSSRTRHKDTIKSIGELLNKYNHKMNFNWTLLNKLTPYYKNEHLCEEIANKISSAIKDSDVFVLISDKEGTDMFIELGIAIKSFLQNNKPKIYIVGKYNKRSLMHFHPSINHVFSLKEVFNEECPEIKKDELMEIIKNI